MVCFGSGKGSREKGALLREKNAFGWRDEREKKKERERNSVAKKEKNDNSEDKKIKEKNKRNFTN